MNEVIEINKPKEKLQPILLGYYIKVARVGNYNLYLKVISLKFGRMDLGATNNIAEAKCFNTKLEAENFTKTNPVFHKCEIIEYEIENFA